MLRNMLVFALYLGTYVAFAEEYDWTRQKPQEFSKAEVRKVCAKYDGKFISYYAQVYKVIKCERREVVGSDNIMALSARRGVKIQPVPAGVIAKIPLGKAFVAIKGAGKERSCSVLEGNYTLDKANNIYVIKGCKLRMFPDYETFEEHRQVNRSYGKPLLELSDAEWRRIKLGPTLKSILPKTYRDLLKIGGAMEVLPLAEACADLNGKFVSYYSLLYKIESCRKRQVKDLSGFLAKASRNQIKVHEISSQQWISLPNGKEFDWQSARF